MKLSDRFEIVIVRNNLEKFLNGTHPRGGRGESAGYVYSENLAKCFALSPTVHVLKDG